MSLPRGPLVAATACTASENSEAPGKLLSMLATAVTHCPTLTPVTSMEKLALPLASLVTCTEPR